MIISESTNDQLMVMAAHRYCLGRRSYIVGACIEWLELHWGQLTKGTQQVILRDTIEAIHDNWAGDPMDEDGWIKFVQAYILTLPDENRSRLHNSLIHKLDLNQWLQKCESLKKMKT